jgi:hypothetical protein
MAWDQAMACATALRIQLSSLSRMGASQSEWLSVS